MAKLCSETQKNSFSKNLIGNENTSRKCRFKLEYPPIPENLCLDMKPPLKAEEKYLRSNYLSCGQNLLSMRKLKFQCHFEDRKKRIELRRKKILQKLKKLYKIDTEGLPESTTREIIMKAEQMEREKKAREKKKIEKTMNMVTRLLEEQRLKNRGRKLFYPSLRKPVRSISKNVCQERETETTRASEMGEKNGIYDEKVTTRVESLMEKTSSLKSALKQHGFPENYKEFIQEEEEEGELEEVKQSCLRFQKTEMFSQEGLTRTQKRSPCITLEKSLESTPKCVIFRDYKKNKVYLQDLKITNIGLETIHCRYLGIIVHTKGQQRFPVGVAVRDSVKLRPGLCCSTKIRLCSLDDTKELRCSIVYETRRKNKPLQHSWFVVEVSCLPVRAIVRVIPLKIVFPSLTWCEATGPEGAKLLKKIIKIENTGGKACTCRISDSSLITNKSTDRVEEEEEEDVEDEEEEKYDYNGMEEETISSKTRSTEMNNSDRKFTTCEEIYGEYYSVFSEDPVEISKKIVEELTENVFAFFRLSRKFFIEIPPFSTTQIEVRFIPQYQGFHQEMLFVQFEDCDNCREQAIELIGDIKKIPLKAEPQVIDLKTCVANSGVYAGTFKIFNETKGPYSVFVKVPASVKKHAHVYPKATTILPLNYSDFSVRLYPRISLEKDALQYYKEDSRILEFPLFIHPANVGVCKRDYIKIYVFALITNYCLQLTPPCINFGCVTTLETVRTELKLTNHSLALQEYGFVNLPKEVRMEPNMGFGRILPKETIPLYLLYSPGEDTIGYDKSQGNHEFQIAVTSIAKYGGFREKIEPEETLSESNEWLWGEDYACELSAYNEYFGSEEQKTEGEDEEYFDECEDEENFDECEDYFSLEGEELNYKIYQKENKIREFLKEDRDKISQHSFFKRINLQGQEYRHSKIGEVEETERNSFEFNETDESENSIRISESKRNLHIVNCHACVIQPSCRISESVIQLPATPCSSFSLYRFRLKAEDEAGSCSCGFQRVTKKPEGKPRFQGSFEFQYFCPHIKLEPESGFIKPGDDVPITVIYRPEFPAEQLKHESVTKKGQKSSLERKSENETVVPNLKADTKDSKKKQSNVKKKSSEFSYENAIEDIINVSLFELENYDSFAGERSLHELISPFYVETKLQCIIKTIQSDSRSEMTEIHEMVLICPAIKPNFIYLGNSQEINFNKVFIGTKSKFMLEIQNISFERISPSASLLSPIGPFYTPAGVKKVEIDVEHIWRQPLIYAPLEEKGTEKHFFEIFCGSTSIFLTVSGEGIQPEYKILPNFSSCLMEAKPGGLEELKIEIENFSAVKFKISLKTEFAKELPSSDRDRIMGEEMKSKSEKSIEKEESKDKKKPKTGASEKNIRFWDETPEAISSAFKNLVETENENSIPEIFTLAGVDDGNETVIPPFGKQQIKIQFVPPAEINDKLYAVKYFIMLERVSFLKEIIVMGRILK